MPPFARDAITRENLFADRKNNRKKEPEKTAESR